MKDEDKAKEQLLSELAEMRRRIAQFEASETGRKQAEESLKESQNRFQALVETTNDFIWEMDSNGVYTYCSPQMEKLWGLKPKDMLGKTPFDLLPSEFREQAIKAFSTVTEPSSSFTNMEMPSLDGTGQIRFLEISGVPFFDEAGKLCGYRGITRDITERKQAEEKLRESNERYRFLMDNSVDGVWFSVFKEPIDITLPEMEIVRLMDEREIIVVANDALAKMQGFDRGSQLIGKHWVELVSADDNAQSSIAMVRSHYKYDRHTYLDKDSEGNTTYFEESETGNVVDGKLVSSFGLMRDIIERRRMETEQKELERRAYISSRLASIGEMAAGIAHEINNPLTSVIGFADLLLERKDVPDDIMQSLEVIHSGSVRVADIVRQLLTFARQDRVKKEYVNVNEIIENTLAMRTYTMKSGNAEVETHLATGLPGTMGAAGQLQQVFLNIIMNAETEMKKAHGKGKLLIKTEAIDNAIHISFEDDGPGIAPEALDRIFEPFFTTKDVGEGTGLGLSICHGIIAEHRGRLYARSELGHGATFIVELPVIAVQEQVELTEAVVDEAEKVTGAKILVVDDESGVRKLLKQVLTGEGHNVETVDSAEKALERIKGGRYNLILTDIKMPGMSGIELYKNMQKVSRTLARRVVFLTGDVISTDTMDFLSRTKASHITKPFDIEKLAKDINRMLAEDRR